MATDFIVGSNKIALPKKTISGPIDLYFFAEKVRFLNFLKVVSLLSEIAMVMYFFCRFDLQENVVLRNAPLSLQTKEDGICYLGVSDQNN